MSENKRSDSETREEWLLRKGWKRGHQDMWLDYLTRRMCGVDKAESLELEREAVNLGDFEL